MAVHGVTDVYKVITSVGRLDFINILIQRRIIHEKLTQFSFQIKCIQNMFPISLLCLFLLDIPSLLHIGREKAEKRPT